MQVWTMQDISVLKELSRGETHSSTFAFRSLPDNQCAYAYNWMTTKLLENTLNKPQLSYGNTRLYETAKQLYQQHVFQRNKENNVVENDIRTGNTSSKFIEPLLFTLPNNEKIFINESEADLEEVFYDIATTALNNSSEATYLEHKFSEIVSYSQVSLKDFLMPAPIWGTIKEQGRLDGKPDLRSSWLYGSDTQKEFVRLELDIPIDRLLFSDYDSWHAALNSCFLASTNKEDEEFDEKLIQNNTDIYCLQQILSNRFDGYIFETKKNKKRLATQQELLLAEQITESWNNCLIFPTLDLEASQQYITIQQLVSATPITTWNSFDEVNTNEQEKYLLASIQCVFWEIKPEDVKSYSIHKTRTKN